MFKRLFTGKIDSITIAALLVALSSFASRFLGLFRDRVLAGHFGAGNVLDAYYAAFRIPDLIFNLVVLGAISAGFIPIFVKLMDNPLEKIKEKITHKSDAWRFSNLAMNLIVAAVIILSILGIIFAPQLMKILTPGFGPELLAFTVALTRVMFLSPIFLGISSILGGVLQSYKHFFVYSLAPILYNLGIIFGVFVFVPLWGPIGLAWGVVFGAFLHMLIQLPFVVRLGYRFKFELFCPWKDKYIVQLLKMMIPRALNLAVSQINFLVITVIASTLAVGSLAIFNLANNLQSFPIGIIGLSFAIAAFPTLSAIAFDKEKLVKNFSYVFRQIMFFIIPSTVFVIALRAQLVRVILGTGQFNWYDTILTMNTLAYFAVSLFAQAAIPFIIRVFYARYNAKTPFYIGLASVVANVVLAVYFASFMGVAGLALAFSISSIINFALLLIFLKSDLGFLDAKRISISIIKFIIASVGCGIVIQGMKIIIWPFINMTKFWGVFAQGFIAGSCGILMYIMICYLLNAEELFYFINAVKNRLPRKKIASDDQGEAQGI